MLAYDWNFLGLSLEAKPMTDEKVVDGSTFYECDTCDFYIFYQGKWYKQTFVTEDGINVCLYKSLMKKMFGKLFDSNITKGKLIKPDTGTNIEFTTNLPAQIIDLTGYGDSAQQIYTGKNLLYTPDGSFLSNQVTWTSDNNTATASGTAGSSSYSALTGFLSKTIPAGTYTFSIKEPVTKRIQFACRKDSSSPQVTNLIPIGSTSVTFTLEEDMGEYHVVCLDAANADFTGFTISAMQLEAGNEATPFEPYVGGPSPSPDYPQTVNTVTGTQTFTISDGSQTATYTINLGTIELCKIGDYQDYIYKNGDDWYVHKEVSKIDIDSAIITAYNTHNDSHITVNYPDASIKRLSSAAVTNFSNRFVGCTSTQTWSGSVIYGVAQGTNSNYLQFSLPLSAGSSQAEVRTYFSEHPTTVYYVLESAADTKITGTTLINNLNSLLNYTFPAGTHNIIITADNLPMATKLIISEKE